LAVAVGVPRASGLIQSRGSALRARTDLRRVLLGGSASSLCAL
jgi:hypothetical protein